MGRIDEQLKAKPWRRKKEDGLRPPHNPHGLSFLFERFRDPGMSPAGACGLIEAVVVVAEQELRGVDSIRSTSERARDLRQAIVAFLTDIGSENPNDGRAETDRDVRDAARTTLAREVCPIICPLIGRVVLPDRPYRPPPKYGDVENLATLVRLIEFYGAAWDGGLTTSRYGHVDELIGSRLDDVRECFVRVYRELARHISSGGHHEDRLAVSSIYTLNQLLVSIRWWSVLSQARAVSAIPALYNVARSRPGAFGSPLEFGWEHIEEYRADGRLTQSAFAEQHREAIRRDAWAIQAVAGHDGPPIAITNADGFRPLLLDLTAMFVREVTTTCSESGLV